MSVNHTTVKLLSLIRDVLKPADGASRPRKALGIGAHMFDCSPRVLRRTGVETISRDEHDRLDAWLGKSRNQRLGRELTAQLFRHYGYDSYEDLDIDPSANHVCDLNEPLPSSLVGQYDLVFDPTSNYVMNVQRAFENTSSLLKVGGVKIALTMLGDSSNRFDLNPSAGYIIDLHEARGFKVERALMMSYRLNVLPFRRYLTKSAPMMPTLPWRMAWVYILKSVIRDLLYNRPELAAVPTLEFPVDASPSESSQQAWRDTAAAARSRVAGSSAASASSARDAIRRLAGPGVVRRVRIALTRVRRQWSTWVQPDWVVFIVLRKVREVGPTDDHHTTAYYRRFHAEEGAERQQAETP